MALFKKTEPQLDRAINSLYECMTLVEHDSEEYATLQEHLIKLETLKATTKRPKWGLSPDAVFAGIVSLTGIVIIVAYEHVHVMTSKALDRIPKPKPQ